jgi:hypothetical protein
MINSFMTEFQNDTEGLFVWAVAGWLCRESCCVEKAAVQEKLLF